MKSKQLFTKMLLVTLCLIGGSGFAWGADWTVDFTSIISSEGLEDKTDVTPNGTTYTVDGVSMKTMTLGSTAINENLVFQAEKWLARTGGYIHNQSGSNGKSFGIRNCTAGQYIFLRAGNANINSATNATLISDDNYTYIYRVTADGDVRFSHNRYLYLYNVKVVTINAAITESDFPFTSNFASSGNPFTGGAYNVSGTNISGVFQVFNNAAIALFDSNISPSGKYTLGEGEEVTISYTAYQGYYSNGSAKVSVANSDGTILAGYTYGYNTGELTDVTIGGTTVATAEYHIGARSYYNGTNGANGLDSREYVSTAGMNPVVTIKIKGDGNVTFSIKGGSAGSEGYTYTTSTPLEAKMDIANFRITDAIDNSNRAICIGDLKITHEFDAVATPTITSSSENSWFESTETITLACTKVGASIYYTTDGSEPTTGSTLYSEPFEISASSTVKAIAVKSGYANSVVASATYNKLLTQTNVTAAETWDWTKIASGTAYMELTNETTPAKDTEFVLKNVEIYGKSGAAYTIPTGFGDAQKLSVKGQFPFRYNSGGMFQGNTVKFTTEVPGVLAVDFSHTSGSGTSRTLYINGVATSFTTENTTTVNATGIVVPAGDIEITVPLLTSASTRLHSQQK